MILTIDVSNQTVRMGFCDKGEGFTGLYTIEADNRQTEYDYAIKFDNIFKFAKISRNDIEGAIISCVVPSLSKVIQCAVRLSTGIMPMVVGARVKSGIHIAVDDPGSVGADLVATAVGAKSEYSLPCIVVDMSAATTITVIDGKGRYIGGSILPGVKASAEALSQGSALLPNVEIEKPEKLISTNTKDSMKAGIVYGFAGAVDGIVDRFKESLEGESTSVVATGEYAEAIIPLCRNKISVDKYLVHKGLYLIWDKNKTDK